MRLLRIVFLMAGLVLLGVLLTRGDLLAVGRQVSRIGWGAFWILGVFFVAFLADTLAWHFVLKSAQPTVGWLYEIWKIRMVGSAYNQIIPFLGKGGEPIKAVLLKKRCGIGYHEGAASLIVAETINMLSLALFAAVGLVAAIRYAILPDRYHAAAWTGLAVFSLGIVFFFLVQRLKLTSAVGHRLSGKSGRGGTVRIVRHIQDLDDRLAGFYTESKGRCVAAFLLGFAHSVLGAVEMYLVFALLQQPVTPVQAWVIAALVEVIRIGVFFVPSGIGAQEGVLVLMTSHVTGDPSLGLSVALVRRFRELVWILWGALIGWRASITPGKASRMISDEASQVEV